MIIPNLNWNFDLVILTSVISVIFILIVAFIVYFIAKSIIHRLLLHKGDKLSEGKKQRLKTLQSLLTNMVFYIILFISAIAILGEFHIDATGILASAGVLGLAIGFGAKDLVSDVVTGFFMLMEDQINVGEYVTVGTYSGVVEGIGLRLLKLRDTNGDLHYIPNRDVRALTNHSRGNKQALVDLELPISTQVEKSIEKLESLAKEVGQQLEQEIVDGPHVIGVESLTADTYQLRILARTVNGKQEEVERQLRKALAKTLHDKQLV
jgi:small conductance mechanosensitive channel